MVGIIGGHQGHGFHRAGIHAFPATIAGCFINYRQKIGGMHRVEHAKLAGGDHGFAATAAAVADEVDAFTHIFPELYQILVISLLEQVQPFAHVHRPGVTMPGQCFSRTVEGHADIHGGITGPAHVHHFMAAIAHPHAALAGGADHFTGAFVIQHVQRILIGKHRFMDIHTPQLCFASDKQVADEFFFHIHILVEQFPQHFLVDVTAQAHHREFKEAGHGRWQGVGGLASVLGIHQDGAAGQRIQGQLRFDQTHFQDPADLDSCEGLDRQLRHQSGFPFAEQDLEDLVKRLGGRRTLWETVQPINQLGVAGFQRGV